MCRVNRNITPLLSLKFLLKILEVSVWFFGHVGVGNVVVVEGRVMADFFDEFVEQFLFLPLLSLCFW